MDAAEPWPCPGRTIEKRGEVTGDRPDGDATQQSPEDGTKPAWLRVLPLAVLLGGAVLLIFVFDVGSLISLDTLREHKNWLREQVAANLALASLIFALTYACSTALSLPAGLMLTLLGGFLFGTLLGSALVVGGATLGAIAVFLAARTAFGDVLRRRAGPLLRKLQDGLQQDAMSYLLVLRLIPLFPFWLVNIAPAFFGVSLRVYAIATLIGILPATVIYASIGSGLGALLDEDLDLQSLGKVILEPRYILPLVGLACLSLLPVGYRHWKQRSKA